ncbi:energy transducer TonB [Aureitalea sp. L0-47]|uniref:energy transducer TonB n=1 Tax=Aureitalea sp. L0-47 TaxID=2816962 RepID=UPI0022375A99|nr:energy transducer TonB [Aureitalea sp. L0-47]MCW5518867.1 energy transducer TonB [Aureitalea sp. L0-47]
MKPSVQNFRSDQPKMLSKREDKKSVNHKWNSRLYFQIGLIISLGITILVVESTIGLKVIKEIAVGSDPFLDPPTQTYVVDKPDIVVTPKPEIIKVAPVVRPKTITSVIAVASNLTDIVETPVAPTTPIEAQVVPVTPITTPEPPSTENVNTVEFAPVFPGCESLGSNEERKQCLSDNIRSFIGKKFDTEEFSYLDSGTVFRIYVQFKIDTEGKVTEIKSRAPERELENEAERVINLLPRLKPGMQGDKPVNVVYRVPIVFEAQ